MTKTTALIFGHNKYASEIIKNIKDIYKNIKVYSLDAADKKEDIYDIEFFDLSDEWDEIEKNVDIESSIAFCALEDPSENIFLTISLRSSFKNLTIITIASNKENSDKLKMAGATKVIPIVETTSDIITNVIQKPISNRVLNSILYEESDLKIAQIQITDASHFKDEKLKSIDWTHYNGIIILSVIHENMQGEFIYSKKAKEHVVKSGDILVVVGYERDILEFENLIGSRRYVNWNHWSR